MRIGKRTWRFGDNHEQDVQGNVALANAFGEGAGYQMMCCKRREGAVSHKPVSTRTLPTWDGSDVPRTSLDRHQAVRRYQPTHTSEHK